MLRIKKKKTCLVNDSLISVVDVVLGVPDAESRLPIRLLLLIDGIRRPQMLPRRAA